MAVGGIIGAIVGGVVGGIGGIHNIRSQQKAMRKAYIQQMSVLMKNYNYNQNALTTEERYSLESAKSNLFNIEFNAIQNNAQVSAALSETGTEGRTSKKISRAIEGQTERRKTSVIDNYYQDIGEIRQQKDALYIQVKDTVEQAEENFEDAQASDFQNVMSVFQSSVNGSIKGFMIGSGIGGGFSAMAGGGSSIMGGAGSSSVSLAGIGSSGALSTGAAGASSAGSMALSAGSSGWSWGNFLGGFNQEYTKYNNMFQGMNMLSNMFGSSGSGRRNNSLYRYNFVY